MTKIDRMNYPGKGNLYPDTSRPTRANLNHGERVGQEGYGRLSLRDFGMGVKEKYGPLPMVMLMPMLVVGLPGLIDNSIGTGMDLHGFGSDHTHSREGVISGGIEGLVQKNDVNLFYGDNVAMIGRDGVVDLVAPGVNLFNGESILDGNVVLNNLVNKEVVDDTTTRYQMVVDSPELWDEVRLLVLQSGKYNNSRELLKKLEKVEGYGKTGNIFLEVKQDFSNQNWKLRIWGISAEKKDVGNGVFIQQDVELGTKNLEKMPVFAVGEVKNAVLVPVMEGQTQIIVELPYLEGMKKSWREDNGLWKAIDENGKEWVLGANNWEEAISPEEKQFNDDMKKWGIDIDVDEGSKYVVERTQNSGVLLREVSSGDIIYYEGAWLDSFIGQYLIANNMCKKTDWVGGKFGSDTPPKGNLKEFSDRYTMPLREYSRTISKNDRVVFDNRAFLYYLGGENYCWAEKFIPVMREGRKIEDQTVVYLLWKDVNGKPQHEKVFSVKDMVGK